MSALTRQEVAAQRVLSSAIQRIGGAGGTDQHLREIFERSFEFIVLIAPDGLVLEANQRALSICGTTRKGILGTFLWDAPSWAASTKLRSDLRASVSAAARGVFVRHEIEVVAAGEPVTIDLSLKPVTDAAGDVVLIISEGRDITERKRSERARQETEERFNRIVAIAADAIISIDEDQRITLFNQGAEQMFGYSAFEVMSQPLDLLLPAELAAVHRTEVQRFAASPTVARHMGERREIFGRRKNGEVFRADASISKVVVNGNPVFTAVVRDVTERWVREEERGHLLAAADTAREDAERARERITLLSESSAGMSESLDHRRALASLAHHLVPNLGSCCLIDVRRSDGSIERVEALHQSPELRQSVERLRHIHLNGELPFLSRAVLESGEPALLSVVEDEHLQAVAQDEAHLAILRSLNIRSATIVPLVLNRETIGAITILRDDAQPVFELEDLSFMQEVARRATLVIENIRLYERSQWATEQRDQVLGVVSHDLRNPLAAIAICASSLQLMPEMHRSAREKLLGTIAESAHLMNRLIEDLLDIASIEAGKLSFHPTALDPVVTVAHLFNLFENRTREKQLNLVGKLPDNLPPALADGDRLLQALANLVDNAIKFTPNHGTITVGVEPQDESLLFVVSDGGVGIPEEELPHVFDRFWHRRRGSLPRGTGLGLAITKGIVEGHGGRIWVESNPGKGTTIRFTIPRVAKQIDKGDAPVPPEPQLADEDDGPGTRHQMRSAGGCSPNSPD